MECLYQQGDVLAEALLIMKDFFNKANVAKQNKQKTPKAPFSEQAMESLIGEKRKKEREGKKSPG